MHDFKRLFFHRVRVFSIQQDEVSDLEGNGGDDDDEVNISIKPTAFCFALVYFDFFCIFADLHFQYHKIYAYYLNSHMPFHKSHMYISHFSCISHISHMYISHFLYVYLTFLTCISYISYMSFLHFLHIYLTFLHVLFIDYKKWAVSYHYYFFLFYFLFKKIPIIINKKFLLNAPFNAKITLVHAWRELINFEPTSFQMFF